MEALRRQLERTSTANDEDKEKERNTKQEIEIVFESASSSQGYGTHLNASLDETDTASHSMPTNAAVASG